MWHDTQGTQGRDRASPAKPLTLVACVPMGPRVTTVDHDRRDVVGQRQTGRLDARSDE